MKCVLRSGRRAYFNYAVQDAVVHHPCPCHRPVLWKQLLQLAAREPPSPYPLRDQTQPNGWSTYRCPKTHATNNNSSTRSNPSLSAPRSKATSGYINLMKIKATYFERGVFPQLMQDIDAACKPFEKSFREELFDKLYDFFRRYFSESGSIYFRHTAASACTSSTWPSHYYLPLLVSDAGQDRLHQPRDSRTPASGASSTSLRSISKSRTTASSSTIGGCSAVPTKRWTV